MAGRSGASLVSDAETTAERMRAAGFTDVETGPEPAPTVPAGAEEFRASLMTVQVEPSALVSQ